MKRSAGRLIRFLLLGFIQSLVVTSLAQDVLKKFATLIDQGDFGQAQKAMRLELAEHPAMPVADRLNLEFEIDRLDRIKLDFTKTKEQVKEYIKKYIPEVTENDLNRWELDKSLECMLLNGKKLYFNQAAANLFRIDPQVKQRKAEYEKKQAAGARSTYSYIEDARQIIEASATLGLPLVKPKRFRITYTLTIAADIIPNGETVRAWLPFPRADDRRQTQIEVHSTHPQQHLIADNHLYKQRTLYMEQNTLAGKPTIFQYCFSFTSLAEYVGINPDKVQPYDTNTALYKNFTAEQPPHIVFTPELREASRQIIGEETNPYLKAKRIFAWIDNRTPWASAREYSTIRNLSMYAYENRHGDCGIQTLLFMTLARMNGIPVHWQSGYEMMPGEESMHDWCEMYLEPYGWVLVDQSYGVKNSGDERVKWFCLGNADAYRWIVNDDFSQALYPAKIFPRSETVDLQRGEVEWRGGNLYFDKWDYDWQIERLD